jgi:hypothetical protein
MGHINTDPLTPLKFVLILIFLMASWFVEQGNIDVFIALKII